jgi:PKD repeat protein
MNSKRKFLALSLIWTMLLSITPIIATTATASSGNSTGNLTVSFTANVTNGTAPLTVSFTSNCTGNPTNFKWAFGDGTYSDQKWTALHTYAKAGKYDVSLTVSNAADKKTDAMLDYIVVSSKSPHVDKILCTGKAPWKVSFKDKSKRHISSYWNLGDGTISKSKNFLHVYKNPGKYPVTLKYITVGHVTKTLHAGYILVK